MEEFPLDMTQRSSSSGEIPKNSNGSRSTKSRSGRSSKSPTAKRRSRRRERDEDGKDPPNDELDDFAQVTISDPKFEVDGEKKANRKEEQVSFDDSSSSHHLLRRNSATLMQNLSRVNGNASFGDSSHSQISASSETMVNTHVHGSPTAAGDSSIAFSKSIPSLTTTEGSETTQESSSTKNNKLEDFKKSPRQRLVLPERKEPERGNLAFMKSSETLEGFFLNKLGPATSPSPRSNSKRGRRRESLTGTMGEGSSDRRRRSKSNPRQNSGKGLQGSRRNLNVDDDVNLASPIPSTGTDIDISEATDQQARSSRPSSRRSLMDQLKSPPSSTRRPSSARRLKTNIDDDDIGISPPLTRSNSGGDNKTARRRLKPNTDDDNIVASPPLGRSNSGGDIKTARTPTGGRKGRITSLRSQRGLEPSGSTMDATADEVPKTPNQRRRSLRNVMAEVPQLDEAESTSKTPPRPRSMRSLLVASNSEQGTIGDAPKTPTGTRQRLKKSSSMNNGMSDLLSNPLETPSTPTRQRSRRSLSSNNLLPALDLPKTPRQRSSRAIRTNDDGENTGLPPAPPDSTDKPPKKTRAKSLVLMRGGEIAAAIAAKTAPPTHSRRHTSGAPPMTPGRRSLLVSTSSGLLSPHGSHRSLTSNQLSSSMRSLGGLNSSEHGEDDTTKEPTVIAPILAPSPRDKHSVTPATAAKLDPEDDRPLPGDDRAKKELDPSATPAGRRKVRQQLRADYVTDIVGDGGQTIDPKDIVLDPAKWPKDLDSGKDDSNPSNAMEESDDEDDATVDTLANFVNTRLLSPKKKKLSMNLSDVGHNLKKNVANPVKKYVTKKAGKDQGGNFSSYED
jgi:hypothetical protein